MVVACAIKADARVAEAKARGSPPPPPLSAVLEAGYEGVVSCNAIKCFHETLFCFLSVAGWLVCNYLLVMESWHGEVHVWWTYG